MVLLLGVFRHGARSPVAILPLNATSVNFNDTLALLEKGWDQHYETGKYLRNKYGNFISSSYSTSEVYIQATSSSRTVVSA